MTLNEIFFPGGKQHILRLKSTAMEASVREMVDALQHSGRLKAETAPVALKALLDREQVSSTGIGNGIAIPHARTDAIPEIVGLVAVSKAGVEFHSIDGQPVHVALLVLSPRSGSKGSLTTVLPKDPKDSPASHLNTLAEIARYVRTEKFQDFMRRVKEDDSNFPDFA